MNPPNAGIGRSRERSGHRSRPGRPVRRRLAACGLLLAACGSGGPAGDGEGRVTVSPEAVHVLGAAEVVSRVVDLEPAGDGRVWVLNGVDPFFVVFGADGRVEREFGAAGEGPMEFGAPVALVRGPVAGDVWAYDVVRHALIRVSGDERRDVPLPRDSISPARLVSFEGGGFFPAPPWRRAGAGGILLARSRSAGVQPGSAMSAWDADIVRIRLDAPGGAVEVHTPVADLLGDPAARYPGATLFLPYPLWTVCADGTLGLYDPLDNELRRIGRDGRELGALALPEERRLPLTFDRMFGMVYRQIREDGPASRFPDSAAMRAQIQRGFGEVESASADVFPEYADLRCTPDGALGLQRYDVAAGRLGRGPDGYRVAAARATARLAAHGAASGTGWIRLANDATRAEPGWATSPAAGRPAAHSSPATVASHRSMVPAPPKVRARRRRPDGSAGAHAQKQTRHTSRS